MRDDVRNMLAARSGHFLLESGHHGDLWLDLEMLCLKPRLIRLLSENGETKRKADISAVAIVIPRQD